MLLKSGNAAFIPLPLAGASKAPTGLGPPRESAVYKIFAAVAAEHGRKAAVVDLDRRLTYDDLIHASAHLAKQIASVVPAGQPIGILIPNSADATVAALASLAAGCPYVPLDPAIPASRNRAAIADANLGALIVRDGTSIGDFDFPLLDVTQSINAGRTDLYQRGAPDGISAVFYTSGSTGAPKGVCLEDNAFLERARNATDMMQITAEDNFALLSAPTAIASLWMTYAALLNGATLHFMDPRQLGIGGTLRLFREHNISATFAVPALLRELSLSSDAADGFQKLRAVRTGGDVLPSHDLKLWRSVLPPSCRLWISLASTEMPAVFQWIVPEKWIPDGPTLPVGFARTEIAHEIVDEGGNPVAAGEAGELVVKSRDLAVGYWARGRLQPFDVDSKDAAIKIFNSKDLVRLRPDGLVEMLGRKDRQVKIQGHRVNLIEVESQLRACAGVSSSAAIALRDDRFGLTAVAFVVPTSGFDLLSPEELRSILKSRLPPYMVPRRIHVVERIPLLPTYKVDVRSLEDIDRVYVERRVESASHPSRASQKNKESTPGASLSGVRIRDAVRAAWMEALKGAPFEENVSFEAAGGDSLAALHMFSIIEAALKVPLSFDHFEIAMTADDLLVSIDRQCEEGPGGDRTLAVKPLRVFYMPTAEGDTLLQAQLRKAFGQSVKFEVVRYPTVRDMLDAGSSFDFLIECVVRQIMARLDGPLCIMGYSFGGFVAWAAAARIKEQGGDIGLVALIDARRRKDAQEPVSMDRVLLQIGKRIVFEPMYALERAFQSSLRWFIRNSSRKAVRRLFAGSAFLPPSMRFKFELNFIDQLRMASARKWRPPPMDCPAVLFRSNEFLAGNPDFGWKALCPSLEVVPVHGTHDTLLYSPDREYLCERVLATIETHGRRQTVTC